MRKWPEAGKKTIYRNYNVPESISIAILKLLILRQDLSLTSIQPDCVWITDLDHENSLFFKVAQKVAVFHSFWAESAKTSLRWHWGYLRSVNAHHCHVNAVGRLWWSSKRDYIWAGSTLNSHFVFKRHKEVWGLPSAIREITAGVAVLSALLLCRINMLSTHVCKTCIWGTACISKALL